MAIKKYKRGDHSPLSKNFKVAEFACKCGACGDILIDERLVEFLQAIRNRFGKSVVITSGYRCKDHNKRVGGSSTSYHVRGQAADIVTVGVSPSAVAQFAESIGVLGVGLYGASDGSFVHIDTRKSKLYWCGHSQSKRESFGGSMYKIELPVIHRGCTGEIVRAIQAVLFSKGYDLGMIDGIFGANTENAVELFQKENNLPATGAVDERTMAQLLGRK